MRKLAKFSRSLAIKVDGLLGTSSKKTGGKFYRHLLRKWSMARRFLDPIVIRLRYKTGKDSGKDLRLHLGCGSKHFDGYINVDMWITEATDFICDINRLPWPKNSVSLIESYHVIEHISHRKTRETLSDWLRVLKPGGKMILECPHFDKAVREYLDGNENRLINIFGWQRSLGDAHLYGYNPGRMIRLLNEIGFEGCKESEPQSSQSKDEPSFRIECEKPDNS